MLFEIIVADPPWENNDQLTMGKTSRGAASTHDVLSTEEIIKLDVKSLAAQDSMLGLWVLGSMLTEGMDTMKAWGFVQKQTWVWVKTKQEPLKSLQKHIFDILKKEDPKEYRKLIKKEFSSFKLDDVLNFYMGHSFRQTHEIALIGARGKYTKLIKNKSQRSVHISPSLARSEKPEEFQDRLDLMVGSNVKKLELFARRDKLGWDCFGNDCPSSLKEDIRDSIKKLKLK